MAKTTYLIDFENVHDTGIQGMSKLTADDIVYLFYTEHADKISLDIITGITVPFRAIKVAYGKQSLDMHLVSYLGFLLGQEKSNDDRYIIVSKDNDYAGVTRFWCNAYGMPEKIQTQPTLLKPVQVSNTLLDTDEKKRLGLLMQQILTSYGEKDADDVFRMRIAALCTRLNTDQGYVQARRRTGFKAVRFLEDFSEYIQVRRILNEDWAYLANRSVQDKPRGPVQQKPAAAAPKKETAPAAKRETAEPRTQPQPEAPEKVPAEEETAESSFAGEASFQSRPAPKQHTKRRKPEKPDRRHREAKQDTRMMNDIQLLDENMMDDIELPDEGPMDNIELLDESIMDVIPELPFDAPAGPEIELVYSGETESADGSGTENASDAEAGPEIQKEPVSETETAEPEAVHADAESAEENAGAPEAAPAAQPAVPPEAEPAAEAVDPLEHLSAYLMENGLDREDARTAGEVILANLSSGNGKMNTYSQLINRLGGKKGLALYRIIKSVMPAYRPAAAPFDNCFA